MKSTIIKRSVVVAKHKTSVSLEDAFWESLQQIAKEQQESVPCLIASIDAERRHANLSSAIRLFVLQYYRDRCTVSEHIRAEVLGQACLQ